MSGLYLYCIRNKHDKVSKVRGIDGISKIIGIPYKDIEAVVSTIDLKEYGSKKLAQRAKEDLKWIIKHAERHEKVIEHAMRHGGNSIPVIPMKFGTMFEKAQHIENVLKKRYKRFKNTLAYLAGKQEWSVKVYVKEDVLKEKLQLHERAVKAQMKRAEKLPRGADYFGELAVKQTLAVVMQKKIYALGEKCFLFLAEGAIESRQSKLLTKEISGHEEPMILNGAYLVNKDHLNAFVAKIQKLKKFHPECIFEYTGPWPPYNFVT
jgi:hypothetical protein